MKEHQLLVEKAKAKNVLLQIEVKASSFSQLFIIMIILIKPWTLSTF